ncbi:UDP-N-acetylgalactosamine-undecaprenyl-phosphate N-acetylgalactosaminephosphotransferase [compost metagenome]|uniref:sugar transferase n=1 Tax=Pedobacter ghigonis TaxID=2730403 RepID=UPI000FB098DD|nr:sugar transferase [Pedobacter ghigonis]
MKIDAKRIMDIIGSGLGLIILLPLLILIMILVALDSKGPIFFQQSRVGRNMRDFKLLKFRTMYYSTKTGSLLTIGNNDSRITKVGHWLRKYKLDELPQLVNVLSGEMSLVGPRPEVRKYVDMYTDNQRFVLSVKPGITDWASVEFFNENELLANAEDPENYYVQRIIPIKIKHNLRYITNHDVSIDLKIIFLTLRRMISN